MQKNNNLVIFSDFQSEIKKTKEMNSILKKFEILNSLIILDKTSKDKVEKSIRNIPNIKVTDINHFSAFDIVKFKKVVQMLPFLVLFFFFFVFFLRILISHYHVQSIQVYTHFMKKIINTLFMIF